MRAETERRVEEAYAKLLACTDHELAHRPLRRRSFSACSTSSTASSASIRTAPSAPSKPWTAGIETGSAPSGLDSTVDSSWNTVRGSWRRSPRFADRHDVWDTLDGSFVAMIVDRYEADIAFSFAHSLRRQYLP